VESLLSLGAYGAMFLILKEERKDIGFPIRYSQKYRNSAPLTSMTFLANLFLFLKDV
jgi:hypothetical protein